MNEKIKEATETLKLASQMSEQYYHKPLTICYSGGKDSDVLLDLALRGGIPFEIINSHTTVDAPPTVYHIREVFEKIKEEGFKATILYPTYKGERTSMWELIPKKQIPPTRIARYCCQILKEQSTPNSLVALGVRANESVQRAQRNSFEVRGKTKKQAKRFSLEHTVEVYREANELGDAYDCTLIKAAKENKNLICNPIINWTDRDIWGYIREHKIKYNPLYDMGYCRVGCIGCPMASKERYKEFRDFPKFELNYKLAFGRMLQRLKESGINTKWKSAEDVFLWWMEDKNVEGQLSIDDWIEEKRKAGALILEDI